MSVPHRAERIQLCILAVTAVSVITAQPGPQVLPAAPAPAIQNVTEATQQGGTKPEVPTETGQAPPHLTATAVSKEQARALKPAYHITAATGWINDPNGMFQRAGFYHVFYQWNPVGPVWGSPYWGHIVSTDLVHWQRLPPALMPDTDCDYDGVFSGSATVLDDGTPVLFYTGVSNFSGLGYYKQAQALARPANLSDPHLRLWIKSAANPVIGQAPPAGTDAEFRDPTTAWKQDGLWYTAVGAMESCQGAAAVYSSPDFQSWTLAGAWATQASLGQAGPNQCVPPNVLQPGIGNCDQFGTYCRMWECPDVFEIGNGTWVLKWSDQSKSRSPYSNDWYVLGGQSGSMGNNQTAGLSTGVAGGISAFVASVQPTQQSVDFGSVYASKSFMTVDGRRVLLGWVFETAAGCEGSCSAGTNFTDSLGWQGAHTLPREVTLDAGSNALLMNPVQEVERLRTGQLAADKGLSLPTNSTTAGLLALNLSASASHGRQLEAQLAFYADPAAAPPANSTAASAQPFCVGLQLGTGAGTYTRVLLNGTAAAAPNGTLTIRQAGVYVDRIHAGARSNSSTEGGPLPLPARGLRKDALSLRVFVDRSIVEVYALEGRGRVTSRIYPEGVDDDWTLAAFGRSPAVFFAADAAVYELGQAFAAGREDVCC